MGVEGVAGPGQIEAQVEASVRTGIGHAVDHGLRFVDAHAVFASQPVGVGALSGSRRTGIELERPPSHLDRVAMVEPRERVLEVALADVAPGTDDVGPDVDPHEPSAGSNSRDSELMQYRCPVGAGPSSKT